MLCRLDSIRKGVLFLLFSFCLLFVCQCLFCLFVWSRKMHFFGAPAFWCRRVDTAPNGGLSRPPLPALFFSRRRRPWRRCPVSAYCGVVHRHGRGDKVTLDGVAAALRRRKQDRPHDQDQPRAEPRSRGHCLFPSLLSGVLFAVLSGCPSDRDARSSATRHPFVWAPFPFFFPARPKLRFSRKKKRKSLFLQKSGSVWPGCRCRIVACRRARCPYILFDCLSRQTTLRKKGPAQTCTRPMAMGDGRFLEKQRAHAAASVETEKKTEEDGAHLSKP